jgi:hypothetical protein
MKQLSQLAAGAALVLAALGSSSAIAGPTCQLACTWVGSGTPVNTYVGSFNSSTPDVDAVSFNRTVSLLTTFSDVWLFELNPSAGNYFINSFFNMSGGGINNFKVELFNVTTTSGCALGAGNLAGHCSGGYTLGTKIAESGAVNFGGTGIEGAQPLAAPAFYAWVVSGTRVGATFYQGSASITPVPEPTSLALVGAGLLAAAIGARRKRAA